MENKYVVECKDLCKIYELKKQNKQSKQKFYALKDISFQIGKGEIVGVLGTNGSGKSTLSSIIAGISCPNSGSIKINGTQALIAINSGLNNQLTGLENIKYKGALLGLSKARVEEITKGVIEFSELGEFLYQPVKSYSSGMKSRLGFSISICLDPDIVIIDEALSVGDSAFAAKCIKKMEEFKNQGKTIFFISHSLPQVKEFCNKALWIEGGILQKYGDIDEVAGDYAKYVKSIKEKSKEEKKKFREEMFKKRIINEDDTYSKCRALKRRIKKFIVRGK